MSYEQIKDIKCKSKVGKEELLPSEVSLVVASKLFVQYLHKTSKDVNGNFFSIKKVDFNNFRTKIWTSFSIKIITKIHISRSNY